MSRLLRPLFTCGGFLPRALSNSFHSDTDFPEISNPFNLAAEPDLHWMFESFCVGMSSVGLTAPNPAVGCIVVKNSTIRSAGATEIYRKRHAERVAIENIRNPDDLCGSTLYVTLEPCAHVGHQPACSTLVAGSTVARVVIATTDPNPKVNGKGRAEIVSGQKEVHWGPLSNESRAWNLPFFFEQTFARPLVVAKWAQSIDGCLCDEKLDSQWISGKAARSYSHWLRQKYDVILVGAGTVLADAPSLTARDCAQPINRQPLRAIYDPNGRILNAATAGQIENLKSRFLSNTAPFIYVTKSNTLFESPWAREFSKNALIVCCDQLASLSMALKNNVDVQKALGKPLQSLFVEGGPRLLSALLNEHLIDLAHIFIAPVFMGGARGRVAPNAISIAEAKHWTLVAQERLGQDILLECMPSQLAQKIFESG